MMTRSSLILLLGLGSIGCGTSTVPRTDGGALDGDVSADADVLGDMDADGDGVSSDRDCDDGDPMVGATAERPCMTVCGAGTERCAMGIWSACDAPSECGCETPGAMRLVPCERCGMRSERCGDAGMWEAASSCLEQGECEVAAVESRTTERCGTEERLCGSSCNWGEWSTVVPDGECTPGLRYPCPGDFPRGRMCDETCHLEEECR